MLEGGQPCRALKVRGALNKLIRLTRSERAKGVVTASAGNHGQGVAYAALTFGVPATVYVPSNANQLKIEAIKRLGARVVEHGRTYQDAFLEAERNQGEQTFPHAYDATDASGGPGTVAVALAAGPPPPRPGPGPPRAASTAAGHVAGTWSVSRHPGEGETLHTRPVESFKAPGKRRKTSQDQVAGVAPRSPPISSCCRTQSAATARRNPHSLTGRRTARNCNSSWVGRIGPGSLSRRSMSRAPAASSAA